MQAAAPCSCHLRERAGKSSPKQAAAEVPSEMGLPALEEEPMQVSNASSSTMQLSPEGAGQSCPVKAAAEVL